VTAVLAGNVSATSEASIVVLPFVKDGKLKALATTYEKRITSYPSLPTAIEQGFPGVRIGHWAGLFAPAGTPHEVLQKMNAALLDAVKSREFADKLVPSGIEPAPYTLDEFVAFVKNERERLGGIARAAGMKPE
jgi:tripartite-type tricarboxylate transporter receptor subunit TctC